ncbi:ABC transporter permease [Geodermatophilus sp. DSM 44513]|uniref:ABC transporter permease n=1 Tax=Geodermatophilus sp. DSM 44513 TaxID=1528104 RepID=UPI00126A8A62|nr:ABC transporter permease [Geodermatophilus sp. DSM 44513]WNV76140.1 ABC transporter permease [Geodermatophilus sp. DSM 44513]
MSAGAAYAVRLGLRRGWTEFRQGLASPQDQAGYLVMAVGTLAYLWINRDDQVAGTSLSYPAVALPGILAALVAFTAVFNCAFALAMEREDGTLLRHRLVPHGLRGYVTGQVTHHSLNLLPTLLVVLVPSALLFEGVVPAGAGGWLTVAWVLALGLLATLPAGLVLGSLVPDVQKVGTWGLLPVLVTTAISGVFFPVQLLWGWLQGVAQVFPTYWIGLGLRSGSLPGSAAALELGGSWRTPQVVLVLTAWAVAGLLVAPVVLRRMARRQSGSQVAAARDTAGQWVR